MKTIEAGPKKTKVDTIKGTKTWQNGKILKEGAKGKETINKVILYSSSLST